MIKDFWQDGLVGKFMAILLVVMILGLISLPFIMYHDKMEMEANHCKRNGEAREAYYIQNMYDGKGMIISSYPVYYTEYKYICDDGYRWR